MLAIDQFMQTVQAIARDQHNAHGLLVLHSAYGTKDSVIATAFIQKTTSAEGRPLPKQLTLTIPAFGAWQTQTPYGETFAIEELADLLNEVRSQMAMLTPDIEQTFNFLTLEVLFSDLTQSNIARFEEWRF